MRIFRLIPLLLLLLASSCGLLPEQVDETKDWTAQQLYNEAKEELESSNYERAIKLYETLQARYPFGRYAQQAQIEVAYAYYRYEEPEQAIAAADRFIKMHPKHPNVDYVHYLKGLANFNRGIGILERFIPSKSAERDPGAAAQSFYYFEELLQKFPDSKYAEDARQRMVYLRNNIAEYELSVARYYFNRGAHIASVNRAQKVVNNYQRTPSVPDALALMVANYRVMEMNDLASDAERVLRSNHPDHPSLTQVAEKSSWFKFKLFE
ncbi:MAG TPA: outer membrane protein assembly factor BamD [Gammaproteobacteria bacterium]